MVIYGVLLNFNFAIAFNMGMYYGKLFYLGDNVENLKFFKVRLNLSYIKLTCTKHTFENV